MKRRVMLYNKQFVCNNTAECTSWIDGIYRRGEGEGRAEIDPPRQIINPRARGKKCGAVPLESAMRAR